MEKVEMSTVEMSSMANVTVEEFKNHRKRYEEQLRGRGYVFVKEGRGDKTVYWLSYVQLKSWEEMTKGEKINYLFGFKPRYPTLMFEYILLLSRLGKVNYYTDKEIMRMLELPDIPEGKDKNKYIKYIGVCKNALIINGYMKPTKEQKDKKYFLVNYNERIEITQEGFKSYWKDENEYKKKQVELLHSIGAKVSNLKLFNAKCLQDFADKNKGFAVKITAREVTDEFLALSHQLINGDMEEEKILC